MTLDFKCLTVSSAGGGVGVLTTLIHRDACTILLGLKSSL